MFSAWGNHVFMHSYFWWEFYTRWMRVTETDAHYPILLVQYKHLSESLSQELVKIGRFLGVSEHALKNKTHINCVLRNRGQALKRKRVVFKTSPFTTKMNKTIDRYIKQIRNLALKNLNLTLSL